MTRSRRSMLAIFRLFLGLFVAVAVVVALVRSWDDVAPYLSELSAQGVVAALVLALLAPYTTMLGWRTLLTDLGSPLPLAPAASVFFVGQLGKYVPGSIWAVLAQAEMGSRLGVPRRRVGVAGLLAIAFALLTGGAIGLPALPVLLGRSEIGGYAVVAVVVILAVACYPPLLNWGIARGLRLLRRQPLEHDLAGRALVTSLVWFTLAWTVSGLMILVLALDISDAPFDGALLLTCLSGFALASAFGMVSVFFPAGFGVRDGFLALILSASMPFAAAVAVAVVSRFLTIFVDVFVAGAGWMWGRGHDLLDDDLEALTVPVPDQPEEPR